MPFPRKTSLTIVAFGALLAVLGRTKLLRPVELGSVLDFQPRSQPAATAEPPVVPPPAAARAAVQTRPMTRRSGLAPVQIIGPAASMRNFYRALDRAAAGQGVARVLHYGDSPVTADSITSDLRSLLQERFGDAGHGFVLMAKPWAWYSHQGIELDGSGWTIQAASQSRAPDSLHGLGGVSFEGGPGAWSTFRLSSQHARMEVSFLRCPAGGTFQVRSGTRLLGFVDTQGDVQPGWASFAIPPEAHEIRVDIVSGKVRVFGASFEKNAPGVIYNSLGLNGGQVQVTVRYFDALQWAAQLQHYRPDLVVVNYGTNESLFPEYLDTYYPGELRTVVGRIRAAVPDASLLIMSPMDKGERNSVGEIITAAALPRIVQIQSQIARETGCAFFNTFEAMGGEGTMARWYASQPRLVTADFIHPFPAGARKVGILADNAILAGYSRYRAAHGE